MTRVQYISSVHLTWQPHHIPNATFPFPFHLPSPSVMAENSHSDRVEHKNDFGHLIRNLW